MIAGTRPGLIKKSDEKPEPFLKKCMSPELFMMIPSTVKIIQPFIRNPSLPGDCGTVLSPLIGVLQTPAEIERNAWLDK